MRPRDHAALIIVDVQKGLFQKAVPVYGADDLLANINLLVERAHVAGAPVVYVQHCGKTFLKVDSDEWQLHARLVPGEEDIRIRKTKVNAFEGTGLHEELKARGVGTVVITGLVTHACVRATCCGAARLGYRVVLVRDGHSNYSTHATSVIERWNDRLARTRTVVLSAARQTTFEAADGGLTRACTRRPPDVAQSGRG